MNQIQKKSCKYIMNTIGVFFIIFVSRIFYALQPVFMKKISLPFTYKLMLLCLIPVVTASLVVKHFNTFEKTKFKLTSVFTDRNRLIIGCLRFICLFISYSCYILLPASVAIPITSLVFLFALFSDSIINKISFNTWQVFSGLVTILGIVILTSSNSKKEKIYKPTVNTINNFTNIGSYNYVYI